MTLCVFFLFLCLLRGLSSDACTTWTPSKITLTSTKGTSIPSLSSFFVELDSAMLIGSGYFDGACSGVGFKVDGGDDSWLDYWPEGPCGSSVTAAGFWVQLNVEIPATSAMTIRVFGKCAAAETSGKLSWIGKFLLMSTSDCTDGPTGFSRYAELDSRHPRTATVDSFTSVAVAQSGSSAHTHSISFTTAEPNSTSLYDHRSPSATTGQNDHTHTFSGTSVSGTYALPYLDLYICETSVTRFDWSSLVIGFSGSTLTSQPCGTRFTALDNVIPRGSATYTGTPQNVAGHSHALSGTTSTPSATRSCNNDVDFYPSGEFHTHTISSFTDTTPAYPPYLDVLFGTACSGASEYSPSSEMRLMVRTSIPPLGYGRDTNFNDRFPRGASAYGGSGGSYVHTHSVSSFNVESSSTTTGVTVSGSSDVANVHTHTVNAFTSGASPTIVPAHVLVAWVMRWDETPDALVSVGVSNVLCDSIVCLNGGMCDGINTCWCPSGYNGAPNCGSWSCDAITCQNGGICNGPNSCNCPSGYVDGNDCSTYSCDAVTCQNDGTCNGPNTCSCPSGWQGNSVCSVWTCDAITCLMGGTCNGPNTCECPTGYQGDAICSTYSCDAVTCANGGVCNGPNTCSCPSGWRGNSVCSVWSCDDVTCQNGGICNGPDSCNCPSGYVDGNDCSTYSCDAVTCQNGGSCNGPNTCSCPSGWQGNSICSIWTCDGVTCQNSGTCNGPNTCECPTGYQGDAICSAYSCDAVTCANGGVCNGPNSCNCPTGWQGNSDCSVWTCDGVTCNLGADCNGPNTCNCPSGWQGDPVCSVWSCDAITCLMGGTCNGPNSCNCPSGQQGSANCAGYSCDAITCNNGGACAGPNTCSCLTEWKGDTTCSTWTCDGVTCEHGGTCNGPNTCDCSSTGGYFGNDCSLFECFTKVVGSVDVCGSSGTCIDIDICSCWDDFYGLECLEYIPQTGATLDSEAMFVDITYQMPVEYLTVQGYVDCDTVVEEPDDLGSDAVCRWMLTSTETYVASLSIVLGPNHAVVDGYIFSVRVMSIGTYVNVVCLKESDASATIGSELVVIGSILGGVAGLCVVIVLLVVFFIVCCVCRHRQALGVKSSNRNEGHDFSLEDKITDATVAAAEEKIKEETGPSVEVDKSLFTIETKDVKLLHQIGTGSSGSGATVFKANWNGLDVAVKLFIASETGAVYKRCQAETQLLSSISHPYLIRFYGAMSDPPRIGFVLESRRSPDDEIVRSMQQKRNQSLQGMTMTSRRTFESSSRSSEEDFGQSKRSE